MMHVDAFGCPEQDYKHADGTVRNERAQLRSSGKAGEFGDFRLILAGGFREFDPAKRSDLQISNSLESR